MKLVMFVPPHVDVASFSVFNLGFGAPTGGRGRCDDNLKILQFHRVILFSKWFKIPGVRGLAPVALVVKQDDIAPRGTGLGILDCVVDLLQRPPPRDQLVQFQPSLGI